MAIIADPGRSAVRATRRMAAVDLAPSFCVLAYPFLLDAFHGVVGPPKTTPDPLHIFAAAALLVTAFAVPAIGLAWAARTNTSPSLRRLGYAVVVAPTLYVFLGVLQSMARSPIPDEFVWTVGWCGATLWAVLTARQDVIVPERPSVGRWRVAHGIAGAVVLLYVLFHVTNHLFGLVGPDAHAAVMAIGRKVYRTPLGEPVLVAMLLFQIGSGFYLAWQWSAAPVGFHRLMQVATGFYLSAFILGHMNSVFFYARRFLGIRTDWAFATGAPTGIIHDPWNIRLLPHYALGVFFVLTHLASGARVVATAHGVRPVVANRLWAAGVAASAAIATLIIAGMCGVRLYTI